MKRYDWLRRIERLDPETDFYEIYRISSTHEFPWDYNQSLSFALFRTYAVPSLTTSEAETLLMRLRLLPGVREAQVLPAQGAAFLKVDSADFDEHNVLQTLTGKVS